MTGILIVGFGVATSPSLTCSAHAGCNTRHGDHPSIAQYQGAQVFTQAAQRFFCI